jgi:RND family efflux transporter MFP subunit
MLKSSTRFITLCSLIIAFLTVTNNALAVNETPTSPVKIDTVTQISLAATADLMGTLHSRMHIPITAGVNGRLEWVAEPGSLISQGKPLIKMDLVPLQLLHAEQKAQIKRAKINVRYLKTELERLQQLRKSKSASLFQLDQTQSQYDLALMDIEIAELKLKQLDNQLLKASMTAPFDGVVTERLVRAGTDVSRSDTLLKFLDTEHLEARLYVPIKFLAFVHKGKKLALSALDQKLTLPVTSVIPSADPRSQTFEVRILIPEHLNDSWAAGQLIKVTVPIQKAQATLTVHRDALIIRKDGSYVVKIDSDNKVHKLPVNIGKGTFNRVSVYGDLNNGDKVAVRGAERLDDGQLVIIQ